MVARLVVHPLDTIRARMMVSAEPTSWTGTWRAAFGEGGSLARTVHLGVRSLYRGFSVSALVQAPAVATYLSVYEKSKEALGRQALIGNGAVNHGASGLLAEAASAVFWTPMEVVKQRAQVAATQVSIRELAVQVRQAEGLAAFYRGYWITLGVFGPYAMLYFMCYERCKTAWMGALGVPVVEQLPVWSVLLSAASSGAMAAGLTTPLDVVKTRLQTSVASAGTSRPSATRLAVELWRAHGLQALFRGWSARVIWIAPNTAITMTAFEVLKSRLLQWDASWQYAAYESRE
ncbi:hypothetical protein CDCA_CDCA09G2667 [Cyanidium caldarium]|uniref:Mitochondrial carrier protein n=1 Tax=Cyanidium caldarium TaxID=2771 RepID=A0AAV9IWD0_CYACA|nr:hypothetical protein CDCA_CDCA09G2667 [Cyanidium caldarium]